MSTNDVTVSLSRLALAKAIKTPDVGEKDAEPWSKSIIFHQSHIDSNMIQSIVNPQQQNKYRGNGRNQKQQPRYPQQHQQHQQQQQQQQQHQQHQRRPNPPPMHRTRSDESTMYNNQTPSQTRFQPQPQKSNVRSSSQSTSSGSNGPASLASAKLASSKAKHRIVPSDDEEESEEEESEDEEQKEIPVKQSPIQPKDKGKAPSRIPQPSDDDEEEEEDDDSVDEVRQEKVKSSDTSQDEQLYAHRITTLRHLEQQEDAKPSSPTKAYNQLTLPTVGIETHNNRLGESSSIDQWQLMTEEEEIEDDEDDEDDVIEEPIVSTLPSITPRDRTSTYGDMDNMYSYQQQQQMAMHNMQMQQAMHMQQAQQMAQMQQAQQMAQIHQYQQAVQMQQYQQKMLSPDTRKANNRKSVSAMDLMLQLEQEKASLRKNKKKHPDPSKAHLADGLLGIVPEHGQHNVNFQQMSMKPPNASNNSSRKQARTSKLEYNMQQHADKRYTSGSNRPKSTLMYYDQRQMMDPRMLAPMGQPVPTLSMSTPPPMMSPSPQSYLSPMMMNPQTPGVIMPSMSTTRSSVNLQSSKRQSNYSAYNR
ncbi:hypothetical protein BDB01DRAFT_498504 [Pilobolus umbonatus]|nr:hypothetical protein BDB01DRAFT_498504 [Pilobolus umbonatus]